MSLQCVKHTMTSCRYKTDGVMASREKKIMNINIRKTKIINRVRKDFVAFSAKLMIFFHNTY